MSAAGIAAMLLGLVMAPILVLVAWKLIASRVPWQPLPGAPAIEFLAPMDVAPAAVSAAYFKALEILAAGSSWGSPFVYAALARIRIIVVAADSWVDAWGRSIGGQADGYQITINHRMESMLHELAHVVEWHFEQVTDNAHTHWPERGIWACDDSYRAWLSSVAGASPSV